jgi:hypothetical protein
MKKAAITGHTSGLGAAYYRILATKGYETLGFSRTNGYDLRDYSKVSDMIQRIQEFDLFVNNAKPDYAQSQILYRLVRSGFTGKILNIGSKILDKDPHWSDLSLLEYYTQKTALMHAVKVLQPHSMGRIFLFNPEHIDNADLIVDQSLDLMSA